MIRRSLFTTLGLALLVVTFGFLAFVGLTIYNQMDEEYRRFASSHMAYGSPILWQNYQGYPINWTALKRVLVQFWPLYIPYIAVSAFAVRIFYISYTALSKQPPLFRRSSRIAYPLAGAVFYIMSATMASSLHDEWFAGLWVREAGYVAAATFLILPICFAHASRPLTHTKR